MSGIDCLKGSDVGKSDIIFIKKPKDGRALFKPAHILIPALLLIALSIGPYSASADLVYDNGAGGPSGIDNAYRSDLDSTTIQADDFSIPTAETLGQIQWTGAYGFDNTPPATDDFTLQFFLDNGAGAPLAGPVATFNVANDVNRTDSGVDIFGFDVYQYEATISGFDTVVGQTYWLSISNDTTGEGDDWFWGVIRAAGNSQVSIDSGANWSNQLNQHDFQLYSVPEPGFVGLLIVAATSFSLYRQRRRRLV